MSALTNYFTSLANKIRSKLGTSTTYTPAQCVSAIDNVYNKGVSDTKVGTAVASDVRSGKTFTNSSGVGLTGTYVNEASKLTTHCVNKLIYTSSWVAKTWNGFSSIYGHDVWSDGDNIYYSANSNNQYVLDKSTSTWVAKTWNGITNFSGNHIWTDGTNIYYSYGTAQYVLDKSTNTWSTKTWSGVNNFYAAYIWTDGTDIFYSYQYDHYLLGKNGWLGISGKWIYGNDELYGSNIWTDGTNIYHSNGSSRQQVLVKSNFPVVKRGLT